MSVCTKFQPPSMARRDWKICCGGVSQGTTLPNLNPSFIELELGSGFDNWGLLFHTILCYRNFFVSNFYTCRTFTRMSFQKWKYLYFVTFNALRMFLEILPGTIFTNTPILFEKYHCKKGSFLCFVILDGWHISW